MRSLRFAFIFAALTASVAATGASPTLDRIRDTGTVTFAYREAAAPFSFKDRSGRVLGYSVELCTRIAGAVQQSLKLPELKIKWVAVDAASRLDAVSSGRVDAECGTTTITLTRMGQVDFSVPIFVDGGSVLVRADAKIARMADLKDRKVAVIPGTTTERALITHLALLDAAATLVPVKDPAEGAALLTAGKVDGFAGDRIVLADLGNRADNRAGLTVLSSDFSYEPYAIVVRRDDPDFRLAVNRALIGIYKRGEIDPIFQRWLSPLGPPGPLLHSMYYLNSLPE
jgi:glutamate/aspartate transport system substrate-binding protein